MSSIHRQLVDSHSRIKSGSDVDTDRQYGPLSRNHGQIAGPHANIDRCSDEATVRQYGPLWWGLDPSFFAAAHLSIRDIHWLQTYTDYPNICRYRNHPIRLVRALGYVVSVHLFSNRQLFQVDDGTGVISCVQWISEAAQEANASTWHVQLGTLVYVSGRISTFREVRQITVSSISVEDDVMNEALWWMRIQQLKQQVYDVPFEPLKANGNTREVVRKRPNDEPHEVSEAKFQKIVQKFLGQSGLETFKYQTLLNTDLGDLAIRVVSSKFPNESSNVRDTRVGSLFRRTIGALVVAGMVYLSNETKDIYTIITHSKHIYPAVRDVVKQSDSGPGLSMDEIVRQVRMKPALMNVPKSYLQREVLNMVSNSDLYENSRGTYKWVGGEDTGTARMW